MTAIKVKMSAGARIEVCRWFRLLDHCRGLLSQDGTRNTMPELREMYPHRACFETPIRSQIWEGIFTVCDDISGNMWFLTQASRTKPLTIEAGET